MALEGLGLVLGDWGWRVRAARSWVNLPSTEDEAPANPDLLIVDLFLDEGPDGLDGLSRYLAEAEAGIPAIIITGHTDRDTLKALRASGHPVLHKPIAADQLRTLIQSVTGHSD